VDINGDSRIIFDGAVDDGAAARSATIDIAPVKRGARGVRAQSNGSTAIYPGSFDPITCGHLDLIERSSRLVDRLIVAILRNENKEPLFTIDEREEMLREAVRAYPNVEVDSFDGLLVDYAARRGATVIVRGIRAVSDYEYELQMALMNRRLRPEIETVFLMAAEAYSFVSARMVKEVIGLGGSVAGLVPPGVEARLKKRVFGDR
jgi:pantetheine-phosphate adenylyltransferase